MLTRSSYLFRGYGAVEPGQLEPDSGTAASPPYAV
jgi:hypothetical protein